MKNTRHPPTLLLVEDNKDDVFIMRRVLKKANITFPLQVVTDGKMAVDYLAGIGTYHDRERFSLPEIIFLDLKLPFLQGFDVLAWIRQQENLASIQVIILSSSLEHEDREKAVALGVPYLVKPPTPGMILEAIGASGGNREI